VTKIKIEIRKPQYLNAKDLGSEVKTETDAEKTPFIFRLLLIATYVLSGLVIWFVYQKFSAHF
jgi:hypothetical protein